MRRAHCHRARAAPGGRPALGENHPVNLPRRDLALFGRPFLPLIAAFCVLGLLLAAAPAAAVPGDTRWGDRAELGFQQITTQQGLPNEVAIALAQDAQGYLWIGTAAGLARWDGYQARAFRYEPGVAGSLPDNLIQALHADRRGRLWIGTSAAGLVRHDAATQRFERIGAGPGGLGHVSVRTIAGDGADGLWVGTDGGLDHVDIASGRVTPMPMGAEAPSGLAGDRVVSVLLDRQGRLWAGTSEGLFRRPAGGTRFERVTLPRAAGTGPLQPEALLQDLQGRVWVGTNRGGAYVIDTDGLARPVLEAVPARDGTPLSAQRIGAIVEARPGEIWIATLGQGVLVVDAASGQTRRLRHRSGMASSLVDDTVRGLLVDRSGLLWAATHGGVSRTDPRAASVQTIAGSRDGLPTRREYGALFTHSDGRLWLGTHNDGIEIVPPGGGPPQWLRPDATRPDSALPPDVVFAMAEAGDGSVFVGTYRGLYRVSADGRRVTRLRWPGREPAAGTGPLLRVGGTLWVGGLSDGLWRLEDLQAAAPQATLALPAKALSDRRITALARGPGGELWIGTRNGLNRHDPAAGTLLQLKAGEPEGLAAGFVSALLLDRAGRLWVGTYGGGLQRLQADTLPPRWQRIGRAEGLPDETLNALLEDGEGRIWASSENGLAVADPATGRARALRRAEGVVFLSYWTSAATRTPAGELLFGASGGLTLVRPVALAPWRHVPPVVATEVRVGGRTVPLPADGEVLEVPADANQLTVQYAALDFSSPEYNRHEHRLEGYDSGWQVADNALRLASYANLPPGEYRLLLRGSNREGVFGETALALPLRVLPAWHQTWWFRGGLAAAALLAVFAWVQLRTRVLRARRRELQQLVDARTAELQAVTRALEEKSRVLERASIIDPLTGLHNRRFLAEQIEATLVASLRRAQTAPRPQGCDTDSIFFLIDVDRFKRINDDLGHAAGDSVLVQLGLRLQAAMRESDYVVRWGGEEFLAVARDTDRARGDELAERIRAAVADQPFRLEDGQPLAVTCSIGHAAWPFVPDQPQAIDWQGVINLADVGLRTAKRAGRDAWVGVHATERTHPVDLPARTTAAPHLAVLRGDIAVSSSRPEDLLAEALSPL